VIKTFLPAQGNKGRPRKTCLRVILNDFLTCIRTQARRLLDGGSEEPSAAIIDSQSVKTTESGGPRGYDAGKKINGQKRHIMTDTIGAPLAILIHPADV